MMPADWSSLYTIQTVFRGVRCRFEVAIEVDAIEQRLLWSSVVCAEVGGHGFRVTPICF
ncbi:hypothetical protein QUB53_20355 [Microcoleus sp. AT8-B4]|uniref:hypothetical protein n=1 Tax=Microcoleus sp. AT8-B4 TaxID=2818620 RepID=UPI002FD0992B